jgi:hypothetical protein
LRQTAWTLRQALAFIHSKRPQIFPPEELVAVWDVNNEGRIA